MNARPNLGSHLAVLSGLFWVIHSAEAWKRDRGLPYWTPSCYWPVMLNSRIKRRAAAAAHAIAQMANIEASIVALNDEDLLDLADIFDAKVGFALRELALAELVNRDLSL